MPRTRFPEPSHLSASNRAQLARSEADLARLVASQDTQALLARDPHRNLNPQDPRARLTLDLLLLVRQLQGKQSAP